MGTVPETTEELRGLIHRNIARLSGSGSFMQDASACALTKRGR